MWVSYRFLKVEPISFSEGGTNKHLWQTHDQRKLLKRGDTEFNKGDLFMITKTNCLGCLSMFLAIDFWINLDQFQ